MSTTSFFFFLRNLNEQQLVEISDLFPKDQMNRLFDHQIEKLLKQVGDEQARHELLEFQRLDPVGYIDRALRRSGFHEADLDGLVHDLVVKLIVTGNLFSGWIWGQSLVGRFKVAVTNAIRTLATKRSKARRRTHELSTDLGFHPQPISDLIGEFRRWVVARYGALAARVLDHRLEGGKTQDLLGLPGIESSFKLKKLVQNIKDAAREYFQRDPEFFERIERAFADEQRTISKRFAARV